MSMFMGEMFSCSRCGNVYRLKTSLRNHVKHECGKGPKFQCPYCPYKAKLKHHLKHHVTARHSNVKTYCSSSAAVSFIQTVPVYQCSSCRYRSEQETDVINHFAVAHAASEAVSVASVVSTVLEEDTSDSSV